jgi:hypothetical protein
MTGRTISQQHIPDLLSEQSFSFCGFQEFLSTPGIALKQIGFVMNQLQGTAVFC